MPSLVPRFAPDLAPRRSDVQELEGWLEGIRLGDAVAELHLWQRYRRGALLLAIRLCRGDRARAEDLVQEVCIEVSQQVRRGLLRRSELFPHYLRQSLRNRHRSDGKAARAQTERNSVALDPIDPLQPDPLDQLLAAERRQHVLQWILDMPQERDRELLYRFHVLQQDRDEICSELQIEPTHFRRVLSRARLRMRELIEAEARPATPTDASADI